MRIIQDSEDEDDLELEEVFDVTPNDDNADAPSQHGDLSPQPHESGSSITHDHTQLTESASDSLKRTIEAAHRTHFQSPSGASSDQSRQQDAPRSSTSISDHAGKRRKTSLDKSSAKSPAMCSSKKKAPVNYGRSKTLFNSPTLGDRLDGSRQTVSTVEKIWDLPGPVHEEWQHHEPMGLFPDPSSTVPNATATQQQLLDEVMAPAFLGIEPESDALRYEPAKSSVPWSEFLQSSVRNTQEQSDPTNRTEKLADQHGSSNLENGSGGSLPEPTPPVTRTPQLSQRNRRGSSVRLKGSPLRYEISQNNINHKGLMGPPLVPYPETGDEVARQCSPTPSRANEGLANGERSVNELPKSSSWRGKSQEQTIVVSPSAKTKQKSNSVPNSEDDLMAIGLPKEEYKPRPSRSRSLKLTAKTQIDYSVRPEKAARKPRRSRTSGAVENASSVSTPEKVQQICDMGFTPSTTQRALRQNNGDIASAVDWLVANNFAEDELAPKRSSKSKSTKVKKNETEPHRNTDTPTKDTCTSEGQDSRASLNISVEVGAASTIETEHVPIDVPEDRPVMVPSKSPTVKVVIPKSRGQNTSPNADLPQEVAAASLEHEAREATGRKAKRRKTSMDQPGPMQEEPLVISIETPTGKKRGRGRPRKEPKSVESISEEQHEDLPIHTIGTSLQELQQQPNTCTTNMTTEEETARATTPAPAPTSTPAVKFSPALASKALSHTPEKPTKAATGTSSPLNKTKVPYRVGLSKRARIAPLLRVVKK
ncbi:hypothetical protein K458DRAFT_485760 [Lentithecium fluviatile CBS 122367]|uniref:UBA domain-containing protein n=1 Tax=Lentithecium fluviatile CBS 122367 TaxID=1168545 RepID=A0A6G1J7W4_9PLEO|nr:hypothetical protein K458DRAFT_485760 [Lentithecium fluviatile CBS 122367]